MSIKCPIKLQIQMIKEKTAMRVPLDPKFWINYTNSLDIMHILWTLAILDTLISGKTDKPGFT
jgi:hypothetical protein